MSSLILYILIMLVMILACRNVKDGSIEGSSTSDVHYLLTSFVPILIYTLFWGLRYDVGVDYLAYMGTYIDGLGNDFYEPGYLFLQNIGHHLSLPFPYIFIITSFINICSVVIIAKGRGNTFLSFLIFFFWCSETIYFAQNGLRQMLAISMVLFALHNFCEGKSIRGIIFIIIAFTFHKSSIIFSSLVILIYLLVNTEVLKVNKYIVLCLYVIAELFHEYISVTDIPYVTDLALILGYEDQLNRADIYDWILAKGSGVGVILRILTYSLIILCQDKMLADNDKQKRVFYWLFIAGALLWPLLRNNLYLNRISTYMISTNFIWLAFVSHDLLYGKLVPNKQYSRLILSVFLLYNIALMSQTSGTNGCKTYKSIFNNDAYISWIKE